MVLGIHETFKSMPEFKFWYNYIFEWHGENLKTYFGSYDKRISGL